MATAETRERLQAGDGTDDSTQRGCTPWLLISCIVLTFTTAFVFGWGLAAPNMYNSYTEPFLKHENPCAVEAEAKALADSTQTTTILPNGNAAVVRTDDTDTYDGVEDEGTPDVVDDGTVVKTVKSEEPFNFLVELTKGIPQTVFLVGAFLGALTGPFWAKAFDRKRTVFANYIFCFSSSLAILLSYYRGYRFLFYVSRFLLGYQGKRAKSLELIT